MSLSLRQQEAGAAAAGLAVVASALALQSLSPLEQLPVRRPRVQVDFTASVQCQVLDVLDSVPRGLELGVGAV